jgi:hypothetical protein
VIKDDGIDFVFNTPNDKSRPGYLKMGWQEVGKLPVAIRVAGPKAALTVARSRVAASHWPREVSLGIPVTEVIDDLASSPSTVDPTSVATNVGPDFYKWRYGADFLGYRAVRGEGGHLICRVRQRGEAKELVMLDAPGLDASKADHAAKRLLGALGVDHALRIGATDLRCGFVPAPGGPVVTWRSVCSQSMPPLANWHLGMGDVELF